MESKITESKNKLYDDCFSKSLYKDHPDHESNVSVECPGGVGNDELAIVDGRLAQVVKIWEMKYNNQVFSRDRRDSDECRSDILGKSAYSESGRRFMRAFLQCLWRPD